VKVVNILNQVLYDLAPPKSFVLAVMILAVALGGVLIAIGEKDRGITYLVVALVAGGLLAVIAGSVDNAVNFLNGLGLGIRQP